MFDFVNHSLSALIPVLLMLSIVVTNHIVTGHRTDRKTAAEAARFSAALAAELRAMLDIYKMNLDLIDKRANYLLSTRSSIAIYKGNLGRLTSLLEKRSIGLVVEIFAQNERIESVIAAHSNLKCNLTYQFAPTDINFDELQQMYIHASRDIASTCQVIEMGAETPDLLRDTNPLAFRAALTRLLDRARILDESSGPSASLRRESASI